MNQIQRCQLQLGTFVEVSITGSMSESALLEHSQTVFKQIADIEKKMSFYDLNSELSQLNQQAYQHAVIVSDELLALLSFAIKLSDVTAGVFDISVAPQLVKKGLLPDHGYLSDEQANWQDIVIDGNQISFNRPLFIELGGIAKGYAVDKAVAALSDIDCEVIVNAGGDMKMSHWQQQSTAIRVPNLETADTVTVEMKQSALATSGHYFLDQHKAITHPFKQYKAIRDTSVSIFADSCMVADALTKTVFLVDDFIPVLQQFNAQWIELGRDGQITHYD